jgi:TolB-like protein
MNEAPQSSPATLAVGGFVLDLVAGELRGADQQPAPLRRQALGLLLVLGRRAGHVVSKDELMDRVWPGVVVGENSLTQAIADIRRVLGDTGHRLVRNVARRGYMLAPDTAADIPPLSIAVMPLAVDGGGVDTGWFADALHGDLVTELTRMHGILVIARATTATYRGGRAVDPRQVASELRVRHVVLGSLRHEGSTIRLSVALVDGASGVQHWAEVFTVQRARLSQGLADLAMQIARALQPELFRVTLERRSTLSALEVSADDLAMRGVAVWFRGLTVENIDEALQLMERAVALDAGNVRAWNGVCVMNWHRVANGWAPDRAAALRRIDEAAAQLDRLDRDGWSNWQAKCIRAFLHQDWAALLRLTTAWVAQERHPMAFGAHGMALLVNGQPDEAATALEMALRLSPRDSIRAEWQYRLAMAHFVAGRYELACDWGQTAALTNPNLTWPPIHAAAMQRLGQVNAARQALQEHMGRHAGFEAAHIDERVPGQNAVVVDARRRLVESLMTVVSIQQGE